MADDADTIPKRCAVKEAVSADRAVLGAVVGGIAGVIADQAVRHHDYR